MNTSLQATRAPVPESTGGTSRRFSPVREIPLRESGAVAIIDADDFSLVGDKPWRLKHLNSRAYVAACLRVGPESRDWDYIYLHRLICGLEKGDGLCVDHIDGDSLNNRRSNLRICRLGQNSMNRGPTKGRRGFKGVSEQKGRFVAKYCTNYIGGFDSAVEAALAYNAEASVRCGEFSRPNRIFNEDGARRLIVERDELLRRVDQIGRELKEWPCG